MLETAADEPVARRMTARADVGAIPLPGRPSAGWTGTGRRGWISPASRRSGSGTSWTSFQAMPPTPRWRPRRTRADAQGERRRDLPRSGWRTHRARAPRTHRRQGTGRPEATAAPGSSTTASGSRAGSSCPTSRTRSPPCPSSAYPARHRGRRRHRGDPQPREGDLPAAGGGATVVIGSRYPPTGLRDTAEAEGPWRARRCRRRPDPDAPLRGGACGGAHGRRAARERAPSSRRRATFGCVTSW